MKKAAPEGAALSSVGRVPAVLVLDRPQDHDAVYRHMRSATQLAPVRRFRTVTLLSISLRKRRRNVAIVSWSGWSFAAMKRNVTELYVARSASGSKTRPSHTRSLHGQSACSVKRSRLTEMRKERNVSRRTT